jgi:hypothetical protein
MKVITRNPIVRVLVYSTFTGLIGLAVGYSIGYNDPTGKVLRFYPCGAGEACSPETRSEDWQ